LQAAAKEMKQYQNAGRELTPQELDELKQQINIKVDGEHTFQLIYDAGDRYDSMNFTNKLADLFIQKASAKREQKTEDAQNVIDDEIDALKKRMEAQSRQIHDFKSNNVTALPDHIDDNLRGIDSTKEELRDRETKIAEEIAKKASIEAEMKDLEG